MPLFSKALPGDVLLSEALSVKALPLAGPSHLLEASTAGYFRLLASHSTLITRYHPLSHVISPNRIQSHRIALLGWQKDLTLQHEHDSRSGPPPDWPRQTSRLPCRIHVSTVFDILTHKGRAQPVTGQAPPPSAPKREEKFPTPPRAGSRAPGEPPRRRRSVAF